MIPFNLTQPEVDSAHQLTTELCTELRMVPEVTHYVPEEGKCLQITQHKVFSQKKKGSQNLEESTCNLGLRDQPLRKCELRPSFAKRDLYKEYLSGKNGKDS